MINHSIRTTGPRLWRLRQKAFVSALAIALACGNASAQDDAVGKTFNIPPQSLTTALVTYSQQADIPVVAPAALTEGQTAPGVSGQMSDEEALAALLSTSGLSYEVTDGGRLLLRSTTSSASFNDLSPVRFAQLSDATSQQSNSGPIQVALAVDVDSEVDDVDEIVVTGSNIRGANSGTSQVLILDRTAIDQTGFSTIEQVIRSLPQNFAGGPSELTRSSSRVSDRDTAGNVGAGSAANLRGLGADATLVLLNGRRQAAGGSDGNFVDLSLLPLSALERIEVLTDGASAIYGSDAIGGVINFIVRDDYEGAQTRLRFGSVTEGGMEEYQASQTLGKNWSGGNALVSYEYYRRSNLPSADRANSANSDLTAFGGDNFGTQGGNPGTVVNIFTNQTAAIPSGQDGTALVPGDFILGTSNFANTREGTDLFPEQERHSVFTMFRQELIDDTLEFFAEGRFSKREFELSGPATTQRSFVFASNPFFVDPFASGFPFVAVDYTFSELGNLRSTGNVKNYGATSGFSLEISDTWNAELYGAFSRSDSFASNGPTISQGALSAALSDPNPETAFNIFGDGSNTNPATIASISFIAQNDIQADVWVASGIVNGELFRAPAGAVKIAAGFEYREETLEKTEIFIRNSGDATVNPIATLKRDVTALFGEVLIPLIGEDNRFTGVNSLTLSVAGRYEDYSDFGSTTNPKLGLRWEPIDSIALRASYGTSFKAPLLAEVDDDNTFQNLIEHFPFGPQLLILSGNNSNLGPEEATTWSAGFQFSPRFVEGLNLELNFFSIDFKNRIGVGGNNVITAFNDPDTFGPLLTFDPSNEEVTALVNRTTYQGPPISGTDPMTGRVLIAGQAVDAIVDFRLRNLAATKIQGLDFVARYGFDTAIGHFDLTTAGTLLTKFDKQLITTLPVDDVLDTIGNPINFKMRNGILWNNERGFSASAFINYADGYLDDISQPNRPIDQWTTVDLQLRYETGERYQTGLGRNIAVTVSVQNVFDEAPPFVNSPFGVGFDTVNADPRGRFVSVEISKAF